MREKPEIRQKKTVPDDPVEDETDDAVQEDLRDEDEQSQAAECTAGHLVIFVLAMPAKQQQQQN
jgi:hypothetical protein